MKRFLFLLACVALYFTMLLEVVCVIFQDDDFLGDFNSKLAGACYTQKQASGSGVNSESHGSK